MYNSAFSVDWEHYVPEPCGYYPDPNTYEPVYYEWEESYLEKEICNVPTCPGCCFTVVYSEDYYPESGGGYTYMLYIHGVFYNKDGYSPNCENCNLEDVILQFLKELYEEKNGDEEFWDYLARPAGSGTGQFYTRARCYNAEGEICGVGCCEKEYEFATQNTDADPYADEAIINQIAWSTIGDDFLPACTTATCTTMKCMDIPFQSYGSINCGNDIPCNYGEWREKDQIILLDEIDGNETDCDGCTVTFTYRWRETEAGCEPSYTDLEIISSLEVSESCQCSTATLSNLYSYVINWLLLNGEQVEYLGDGDCIFNTRVLSKSCWTQSDTDDNIFYFCDPTPCCWAIYKICNYGGTIVKTLIETGGTVETPECDPTAACELVCDAFPDLKAQYRIKDNVEEYVEGISSYILPNPAYDFIEINFLSNDKGSFELLIMNVQGEEIAVHNFNKTNIKFSQKIDANNLITGNYFYHIRMNGNIVSKGMFNILK